MVYALTIAALLAGSAYAQSTWVVNGAEMPMQEFVNQVAEMTGKTIILDPRQQNAKVTVFSDTELDANGVYELFLTILKVHNLGAVENNGVVEVLQNTTVKQSGADIVDEADAATSQLVTRVVPLSHVQASEVVKTIRPLMPQAAHVAAIDNPNVLILADFASNITRLLRLIEQTDVVEEVEIVHRELKHAWVGTVAAILEEIAPRPARSRRKGAASGADRRQRTQQCADSQGEARAHRRCAAAHRQARRGGDHHRHGPGHPLEPWRRGCRGRTAAPIGEASRTRKVRRSASKPTSR